MSFKREDRYLVLKRKDIEKYLSYFEQKILWKVVESIIRDRESPQKSCVVVEDDWPEYEKVWEMIEERVNKEESNN